ncbi:MAG: zinc ribbon domain-containing protein [Bacteroidetes bacterium]|nr:zinc ribbon domain-containing protein [Bacteroidota bacterium]MCW5894723.1 zinc ribbon domain-containing protein [Bacteroidota bacterium]
MDDKLRCQSCGMPLSEQFGNLGTEVDGSTTREYCHICYANGAFTTPDLTMEGMMQLSVDYMTKQMNIPAEKAGAMANEYIPKLRRWKKN